MTRTIVLAGAPESNQLDWNEKALLSVEHDEFSDPSSRDSKTQPEIPKWRQLEMDRLKMRPALPKLNIESQSHDVDFNGPTEFFDSKELLSQDLAQESAGSDVSAEESRPSQESYEPETEALAQFYDHSFTIHEAIPSSQRSESSQSQFPPETPIYDSSGELFPDGSTTPSCMARTPSQRRLSQAPRPKTTSNLVDIPNASYLSSIQPQTKTVNLIVGVLAISPARTVTTGAKYGKPRETELVEMTVGDDTKTGFTITLWLPREMHVNWKDGVQEKPEGGRSLLRRSLRALRKRDVILIQNVALSCFNGKVHGQSLKGDVTKVDLLFRKKLDDDDLSGCYSVQNLRMATGKDPQILKVKKVRDWLADFVGEGPNKRKRKGAGRMLPEDTQ